MIPKIRAAVESAHSALIFSESDVQAMMESTLHYPVAAFESEHAAGLEFFQRRLIAFDGH